MEKENEKELAEKKLAARIDYLERSVNMLLDFLTEQDEYKLDEAAMTFDEIYIQVRNDHGVDFDTNAPRG